LKEVFEMAKGKRPRRGNGEGSITQRTDGTWQASLGVGYDPITGKPKRVYFYGKTRKEVQEKLTTALGKAQSGRLPEPSKITMGQWLSTWLEEYMRPSLRATTFESYRTQIEKHLIPGLGAIRLTRLQTSHLQKLYNALLKEGKLHGAKGGGTAGLAPKSVRYIHTILHGALSQAEKEGIIALNPANAVRLPRVQRKEMHTLDTQSLGVFLSAARDTDDYAAYLLDLSTGLRRGELLGLRWRNVDLQAGTVTVREQLVPVGGALVFQEVKTALSHRTVGIPPAVVKALRAHRARQAQTRLMFGEAYQNNDLAFPAATGKPQDPRAVTRRFERLLARAGLERIRFHDLRHTYATLSLQEGVALNTIQEALGHYSPAFTMATYAHVTQKMKERSTDKIGNLLDAATAAK
jgi:integrase